MGRDAGGWLRIRVQRDPLSAGELGIAGAVSVVMLFVLALLYPSRYTRGSDIYGVFTAYVAAKVLETFDHEILALGHLMSGHSLKHVAAALGSVLVLRMLWLRRLQRPAEAVH